MTTIAKCNTVDEAQLLKSLLESNGIEAILPDEFTSQNLAPLMLNPGIKVQVADEDAAAARALLASVEPTEG